MNLKRICPECGALMSFVDYSDKDGGLDAWWVCEAHAEHRVDHYGNESLPPVWRPDEEAR